MGRYINPFTDWGFKRLFGQEFSKALLIDFLNDLLAGELSVKDVKFRDKELLPETKDQRGIICDVYCESDTGERFIVEMQNKWQPHFLDRSICYACRSVLAQVEKGKSERDGAYQFLPVYTVCFMNYIPHFDEVSKFRTDIVLADKESGVVASDRLRFIYLALPLFKKKAEECETDFEKWIYVLKHMEALSRMPFTAQKNIFKQLEEYADSHHLNKDEWEAYENSLWIARDQMAYMAAYEREAREKGLAEGREKGLAEGRAEGREKGLAEGREKGLAEGREKGRAEGIAEGRTEGIAEGIAEGMAKGIAKGMANEKKAIALRLLDMGLSVQQVAQASGLCEADIETLRKQ